MTAHRIRGALAFLLFFTFSLSACSTDDTYLPALLADPIGSYEAEGIELIDRDSQGYRAERPFSQPAKVTSVYRILDESNAGMVLQEALTTSEANGWEMAPSPSIPNRFVGYKELEVGEGQLILVAASDEDEGDMRLRILMEFVSLDEPTDS